MHPLQSAYDFYTEKLKAQFKDVTATKRVLNDLAREMGLEPQFKEEDSEAIHGSGVTIKIDEFVNKAPSTALQEYLNKRGETVGAVRWEDAINVLKQGGFDFAKFGGEKAVRMTLMKNTTAFKFLRKGNAFGLKGWYGNQQKPKKKEGGEAAKEEKQEPST